MGMTIAIDKLYLNKMPNSCKECPLTYLDTGDDAYFGANERRCIIDDSCVNGIVSERAYDCPLVEAIPKDQYEARLKDDMVAMLTEIQLEIEELRLDRPLISRGYECYGFEDKTPTEIQQECSDIIQQKINSLKSKREVEDGKA